LYIWNKEEKLSNSVPLSPPSSLLFPSNIKFRNTTAYLRVKNMPKEFYSGVAVNY